MGPRAEKDDNITHDSAPPNTEFIERCQIEYERNPSSRVFAPLAEGYRRLKMLDEAFDVASRGVRQHPDFAAGRIAYARVLIEKAAFNDAVDFTFEADAPLVQQAIAAFIRSMPLAVRFVNAGLPDVLCSHSLPAPELMDRVDPAILERLDAPPRYTDDDLLPRRGSAHLMLWGRDHTPEQLAGLAQRWGVGLFVLGHEKADDGVLLRPPNAVILNSDHARGVYLDVPARTPRTPEAFAAQARRLADGPAHTV